MNNETIQNIVILLNRVDLKGAEVEAYTAAMAELAEMAKENEELLPVNDDIAADEVV
jgi:hypothetical protein